MTSGGPAYGRAVGPHGTTGLWLSLAPTAMAGVLSVLLALTLLLAVS